jgi:putative phosphoribosyl transferase
VTTADVRVPAGDATLVGRLDVPTHAAGVVLFAHGSGSGRDSPRNQAVARTLHDAGIATLLVDLLTEEEELHDRRTAVLRFDIPLLAERLVAAVRWLGQQPETGGLSVGLFGASTGAAAALVAAAEVPDAVAAVVSRGGRPDLAGDALPLVKAPTLLVVGSRDQQVLELNRDAFERIVVDRSIDIVEGATHLFEEPGALDEVARVAADWFGRHLRAARPVVG